MHSSRSDVDVPHRPAMHRGVAVARVSGAHAPVVLRSPDPSDPTAAAPAPPPSPAAAPFTRELRSEDVHSQPTVRPVPSRRPTPTGPSSRPSPHHPPGAVAPSPPPWRDSPPAPSPVRGTGIRALPPPRSDYHHHHHHYHTPSPTDTATPTPKPTSDSP